MPPLRSLFVAALIAVPLDGAAQERLAFELNSKSWIKGSSFDAAHFRAQCGEAGLDVRPVDPSLPKTTHIEIDYEEKRGSGFSRFGVGNPEGWGTDVTLKIRLVEGIGPPLLELALEAETPAGLEVEQFHDGARDALKRSPGYRLACAAIQGALGSVAAQRRLLPWAVFDAQPLALLTKARFQPSTPAEEAYLALARRDFARVRGLGEAAAEPLALLIDSSIEDRSGYGTFAADTAERAAALTSALDALTALDDEERSVDVLMRLLNDYALVRNDQPAAEPVLVAALRKLSAIGNRFSLPLLDEWAKGTGTVAQEAKQAAAAVRRRVEF